MSDFPDDEILYERAKNFTLSRDQTRGLPLDVAEGRATPEYAEPLLLNNMKETSDLLLNGQKAVHMFTKRKPSH